MSHLPSDAKERKGIPLYSGVVAYFPDALVGVALVSMAGNEQHNPGQPLHWSKHKSTDHADCIERHLQDFEGVDSDGMLHADKIAWRALALAQMVRDARKYGLTYAQYIKVIQDEAAMKTSAAKSLAKA